MQHRAEQETVKTLDTRDMKKRTHIQKQKSIWHALNIPVIGSTQNSFVSDARLFMTFVFEILS